MLLVTLSKTFLNSILLKDFLAGLSSDVSIIGSEQIQSMNLMVLLLTLSMDYLTETLKTQEMAATHVRSFF